MGRFLFGFFVFLAVTAFLGSVAKELIAANNVAVVTPDGVSKITQTDADNFYALYVAPKLPASTLTQAQVQVMIADALKAYEIAELRSMQTDIAYISAKVTARLKELGQ